MSPFAINSDEFVLVHRADPTRRLTFDLAAMSGGAEAVMQPPANGGTSGMGGGSASGAGGIATAPFASWLREDRVTVTGQSALTSSSAVTATLLAENDDIRSHDWQAATIDNLMPGFGFDLVLRPALGSFKGPVRVAWGWR